MTVGRPTYSLDVWAGAHVYDPPSAGCSSEEATQTDNKKYVINC